MMILCRCADLSEAEAIRLRLEAEGIQVLISGSDRDHVAMEFCTVRVDVDDNDFDRATSILLADQRHRAEAGPWPCHQCDELNTAAFEICWNCQHPRDELDSGAVGFEPPVGPTFPPPSETITEDQNPYRAVLLTDEDEQLNRSRRSHTFSTLRWTLGALLVYCLLAWVIRRFLL